MMSKLQGTGVAIVTPFTEKGEVDFAALGRVIDHIINGGVDYIVSLGTTGESATLEKNEKKEVWDFTKKHTNKRVPLVAGIGGNNTQEIVKKIADFDADGYDAILSVSPYYNKPSQEGIYQHYKLVAKEAPLPIILYNVPGRTASCISAETTLRLANDCENIIGTKDASGNFDIYSKIAHQKPKDFLLISGDDGIALPIAALGGNGVISVIANALPQKVSQMMRYCLQQNFAEAAKLHGDVINFTNYAFEEGNPAGIKAALKILGLSTSNVRLPLTPPSAQLEEKIKTEMKAIGVL